LCESWIQTDRDQNEGLSATSVRTVIGLIEEQHPEHAITGFTYAYVPTTVAEAWRSA